MSDLLDRSPFGPRDDERFLEELQALHRHHRAFCPAFARIWPEESGRNSLEDLPFLHVGVFKRGALRTDFPGVRHGRTLSSSGSSGAQSRIALDEESSALQARSATAILKDALGPQTRALLLLDRARSLRQRGSVSARLAAAMSLKPLASEIHFLLDDAEESEVLRWDLVADLARSHRDLIVYGFTTILWQSWACAVVPEEARAALRHCQICFVHSGGWKKLEAQRVDRHLLEERLLVDADAGSRVIDFYGLVEQVGLIFPLCSEGFRHVPVWGDVLVRDAVTLRTREDEPGLLQLVNVLARGAPYHSVLTEDLGRIVSGPCPCGRSGKRFELLGRVPKAELRGCANV